MGGDTEKGINSSISVPYKKESTAVFSRPTKRNRTYPPGNKILRYSVDNPSPSLYTERKTIKNNIEPNQNSTGNNDKREKEASGGKTGAAPNRRFGRGGLSVRRFARRKLWKNSTRIQRRNRTESHGWLRICTGRCRRSRPTGRCFLRKAIGRRKGSPW